MRDEKNLYIKLLKFVISMILMCLIWVHRMRKEERRNLDNTLQLLVFLTCIIIRMIVCIVF